MANENNHGGRREGAGRPQSSPYTKMIGVRVTPEAAEYFSQQANKSEYMNALIINDKNKK